MTMPDVIKSVTDKAKKRKLSPANNKIDVKPTISPVFEGRALRAATVTYGRMNPPTIGHAKVAARIMAVASQTGSKPIIFLSASHGDSKNPLPPERKRQLVAQAFGLETHIAKNLFEMMKQLDGKYDVVHLVVGEDRAGVINQLLKYNGREYNFKDIQIHNAGQRDSSSGVSGMSASKMREFASNKDLKSFTNGLPIKLRSQAADIMSLISEHLEYEQLEELDEAALTMAQRLKRAQQMRRISAKIQVARRRALKKRADVAHLTKRARAAAKNAFRKRMLGGKSYAELSLGTRASIDARLKSKQKAVNKLAQRLLPKFRRAEMARKLGSAFTGAVVKQPIKEAVIPGGTIPRSEMPQIKDVMLAAAKIGADVVSKNVKLHDLKIVQKEFDDKKVAAIAAHLKSPASNGHRPIVVSKCGHLVDGHHRALAAMQLGHEHTPAHVIQADMETIMSALEESINEDMEFARTLVEAARASFS